MENKFVNIKKAAEMLGVSTLTLRNWDKNGKFKPVRHPINNYRVYKIEDIRALTEKLNTKEKPEKKLPTLTKKLQIKHLE